jgi:hypothetical protein
LVDPDLHRERNARAFILPKGLLIKMNEPKLTDTEIELKAKMLDSLLSEWGHFAEHYATGSIDDEWCRCDLSVGFICETCHTDALFRRLAGIKKAFDAKPKSPEPMLEFYLDMDGVLVDLEKSVIGLLKLDYDEYVRAKRPGAWEMADSLGIDETELWDKDKGT